jgi:hypothetical protein
MHIAAGFGILSGQIVSGGQECQASRPSIAFPQDRTNLPIISMSIEVATGDPVNAVITVRRQNSVEVSMRRQNDVVRKISFSADAYPNLDLTTLHVGTPREGVWHLSFSYGTGNKCWANHDGRPLLVIRFIKGRPPTVHRQEFPCMKL